jgi:hypothetical protein
MDGQRVEALAKKNFAPRGPEAGAWRYFAVIHGNNFLETAAPQKPA